MTVDPNETGQEPSLDRTADSPRPMPIEWAAAGAVLLSLIAFAMIRLACGDVAWHLATARLAFACGQWPTTNAFSYTFADYPLYQQYPLFQSLLLAIHQIAGWPGLSVLLCAGWLGVFLLYVRWACTWRAAAVMSLPWMIGMMALQRRMILRPDMFSMVWLACELIAIDAYLRRGRRWILLLPAIQLCWVNSHQLFPLGLAVQVALIAHLCFSRWAGSHVDARDRCVPIWPVLLAMGASIVATFGSPIGFRIVEVLQHTGGSVGHHRHHIRELAYIWERPVECALAMTCAAPALYALWRSRRRLYTFDLALWCMSLILVLIAMRGLVFFSMLSIGVFVRARRRSPAPAGPPIPLRAFLRPAMACVTLILACNVLFHRWVRPPKVLGGTQPGLGRSLGDWPDAALAFLASAPPPGEMMNMPWSLANGVLWRLPNCKPFVDSRFEAYPRDFLVDCIASYQDPSELDGLIDEYRPTWIFVDHRVAGVLERAVQLYQAGGWALVYADSQTMILVRECELTAEYVSAQRIGAADIEPRDLLPNPRDLRARQRIHFARLLAALDVEKAAQAQLTVAEQEARGHPSILALIAERRRAIDGRSNS